MVPLSQRPQGLSVLDNFLQVLDVFVHADVVPLSQRPQGLSVLGLGIDNLLVFVNNDMVFGSEGMQGFHVLMSSNKVLVLSDSLLGLGLDDLLSGLSVS